MGWNKNRVYNNLGAELERLQGGGGVQGADVPPGEGGDHLVVSCSKPLAPAPGVNILQLNDHGSYS